MTESGTPGRTPVIAGFLFAGAVILGASFLVGTLEDGPSDSLPTLRIIDPVESDTVVNPVTIEFSTPAELAFDPAMGWSVGDLHLHAMAGPLEIMPAAADIVAQDRSWTWQLPPLDTGTYRLHLSWAGRHHGNLGGGSDTVLIHVAR